MTYKQGDIVREKKYAQPLEVTKVYPEYQQVEVTPVNDPERPKRYLHNEELQPYTEEK